MTIILCETTTLNFKKNKIKNHSNDIMLYIPSTTLSPEQTPVHREVTTQTSLDHLYKTKISHVVKQIKVSNKYNKYIKNNNKELDNEMPHKTK